MLSDSGGHLHVLGLVIGPRMPGRFIPLLRAFLSIGGF